MAANKYVMQHMERRGGTLQLWSFLNIDENILKINKDANKNF